MQIYEDNEAYCRAHPEAKELLTRKLQHVKSYAMRIALANDQVDRSCTMAMLELKIAKNSIDKANEALNEANGALSELTKKKKSSKKSVNAAKAAVDAALEAKQKAREIYIQKIEAVKDMFRMSYTDHPPVITAAHVKTANEIIEFALKSSLTRIVYAIPPQTWVEAKERVIQILKDHGCEKYGEGMTKSSVEKAMKTYHFGEKWNDLLNEMVNDCLIECGDTAPNGGCKIYLYGNAPHSTET